jgi:hypothetical protein
MQTDTNNKPEIPNVTLTALATSVTGRAHPLDSLESHQRLTRREAEFITEHPECYDVQTVEIARLHLKWLA